jgi:hypothetical protein
METLKPLHLSVTLRPTPLRFPFARKAEFCIDRTISLPVKIKDGDESIEARSIGYRFIKYSGDLYSVEQEGLNLESIANEVLSLITPARKLNKEEMEFLNETSEFSCWLGLDDSGWWD